MKNVLLIGGTNIDYIGTSDKTLKRNDSNIGTIEISFGGVMRNVCENMVRLGNNCLFITAIGNDEYGNKLKANLKSLDVTYYIPNSNYPSSSYLAINDANHDMVNAICDSRILDDLNKDFLKQYYDLINEHEYIIIDCNLSEEALRYLFTTFKDKKFICESISMNKVVKYKPFLKNIYLIKCNIYEAQELTETIQKNEEIVRTLLHKGIKNVVVSAGSKNIYYGNSKEVSYVKVVEQKDIVNTTGCGDALFSGVIDYILQGKELREAIEFGMKLSTITLNTYKATSEDISKLRYEHK